MKSILLSISFVILTQFTFAQCTAGFTFVVNGMTVDFVNTSTVGASTAQQMSWTFGDGQTAGFDDAPSITYTTPGTYQVCLLIVDFTNCSPNPTLYYCDSVTVGTPPSPCSAGFTYTITGNTVNFTNTSTVGASTADQMTWTFGDTQTATMDDSPSNTYASPGTYQVCLLIVDFDNCSPNPTLYYCDSITIPGTPPACTIDFTYTTNGLTVNVNNISSSNLGNGSTVNWSFGDGGTASADDSPAYTYAAAGTYQVCLLIVDFACNPNPTMLICDSVTVTGPVGIKEITESDLNLYPNPAQNLIYIDGGDFVLNATYSIYSIDGKMIFNGKLNQSTIDISSMQNGYYLLEIESLEGKRLTKNFLKQ